MNDSAIGFVAGAAVSAIIWISLLIATKDNYKSEAVSHHCAKYNSQTAKFEWVKDIK